MVTLIVVLSFFALVLLICYQQIKNWSLSKKYIELECIRDKQEEHLEKINSRLEKLEILQKEGLAQEEIDFREELKNDYRKLFEQVKESFKENLSTVAKESLNNIEKAKSKFEERLTNEFNDAVEKIKFDEVEYKKTITKKRKEFSRKNSQNAVPQRIHRYLGEDDP